MTHPEHGYAAQIDVDMAPVIAAAWAAGVETSECCQDQDGQARIGFLDLEAMELFYKLIAEQLAIQHDDYEPELFGTAWGWHWELWADGGHLYGTVYFPRDDLSWVLESLTAQYAEHSPLGTVDA
jgi:hypothetical protein